MKSRVALGVLALSFVAAAPIPDWQSPLGRDHPLVGTIRDVAAAGTVTPETLVARLATRRFVILGEKHDNPDHHWLQAWIIEALVMAGRRPAVAFEMVRADQADTLARYLAAPGDAHGLGDALDWRRSGWPAWSMYEPIAEAALRARVPLVAADLSGAMLASLRRGGLDALDPGVVTRLHLDRPLPDAVRARLVGELREAHCGHVPESSVDNLVASQRARDAHMAAAMRDAGGDGAVLIAGAGHARRDMGVPRMLPDADVVSVAFLEVRGDTTSPPVVPFDYVWFTPRVTDQDPCERFRRELERLRRP